MAQVAETRAMIWRSCVPMGSNPEISTSFSTTTCDEYPYSFLVLVETGGRVLVLLLTRHIAARLTTIE